jgi:hypothetical protein
VDSKLNITTLSFTVCVKTAKKSSLYKFFR